MAKASLIIEAENRTSSAIKQVQNDLKGLSNSVISGNSALSNLTGTFKKFGTLAAVGVAIKKVGETAASCWKDFAEAEKKYKQLAITLGDTKAYNDVVNTIQNLSRQTLTSKDEIESMVAELAAMGKSSAEIDKISTAAVALSNVTGKDLNSSMTLLLNTYNGQATQLQKLGVDTSTLTKEQLANGDAVDAVIEKYGELSEEMSKGSALQGITNIKNNLGDIKQDIGDILNVVIAPAINGLDTAISNLKGNFDTFTVNAKGVLTSLPEIFSKLIAAFKADLSAFLRPEDFFNNILNNVTTLLRNGLTLITNAFKLVGDAVANLSILSRGIMERALEGIGNYAMAWIVKIADEAGIDISSVINSIGQWLQESPIGKIVDKILTTAINGVKVVSTVIKNIPQILKIVLSHAGDMITAFFNALPAMVDGIFKGVVNWIAYIGIHLKNNIVQGVEDAINGVVGALPNWAKKLFGIENSKAVDFGVDRTSENAFKEKADNAFASVGDAFAPVRAIGAEIGKEVADLINPQINEVVNTELTLGDNMATWTAKTSDDYFEAAKQNFDSIGDFLSDWFTTFSGDISSDFSGVMESFETLYDLPVFENMSDFVDWFKEQDWSKMGVNAKKTKTNGKGGTDDDDDDGTGGSTDAEKKTFWGTIKGNLEDAMGESGELIASAAQNMSDLGPEMGLLATAVQYILKYLDSDTLKALANSLNPLLNMLKSIAHALSPLITMLIEIIQPVLEYTAARFIWFAGNIRHAIASFINWFAGTAVGRWAGVSSVTDDGAIYWKQALAQARATDSGSTTTSSSNTQQAISGATYSGQQTIYLTVNTYAPVVGEQGMIEFTRMIRSNLEQLAYQNR